MTRGKSDIRERICEIGVRLYNKNFVAANDGNISVRTSENELWITPSGVSKGYMDAGMLIKLDLNGNMLQGGLKPSSETGMHTRIYRENTKIRAVVHAHPPAATAFAVAGKAPDFRLLPEAVVLLGEIPLAPYAMPSSPDVAESIAGYCNTHNCVLLANHGAVTWGEDLETAYFRMETLEYLANLCMNTHRIGNANRLSDEQISDLTALMRKREQ